MDSIAYVPDPHDATVMIHIIGGHSRFTVASCKAAMLAQVRKYDSYDYANDQAAVTYLFNSLTAQRGETLRHRCAKEDNSPYGEIVDRFPIVWLHLMEDIAPSSFESYQLQADSLKLLKPSNYPGENIT